MSQIPFPPLEGRYVRLEPLAPEHRAALETIGADDRIWAFTPRGGSMAQYLDAAYAAVKPDNHHPYVVRWLAEDRVIGMTRFFDISVQHRGAEIGYTWYHPDYWAGKTNPECKFLLLRHGFETCDLIRMQLKTDARNKRSQAAIAKLGAQREGVLRNHMVLPDGRFRDSVYFSILPDEWPGVKQGLERRLAA
ncbi:MAG: GNAT family N-acetyltransferase [Alphaproteobacteria bacterium]|nr:GNAT family N-acetyltransferase [Alphaproteobacteria bacterium]MCB9928855.1 GNAT family N-acetyltransferase [Alphaproteobacteria bacterium]